MAKWRQPVRPPAGALPGNLVTKAGIGVIAVLLDGLVLSQSGREQETPTRRRSSRRPPGRGGRADPVPSGAARGPAPDRVGAPRRGRRGDAARSADAAAGREGSGGGSGPAGAPPPTAGEVELRERLRLEAIERRARSLRAPSVVQTFRSSEARQPAAGVTVRWIIELHRLLPDRWVTLREVYRCTLEPERISKKIAEVEALVEPPGTVRVRLEEPRATWRRAGGHHVDLGRGRRGADREPAALREQSDEAQGGGGLLPAEAPRRAAGRAGAARGRGRPPATAAGQGHRLRQGALPEHAGRHEPGAVSGARRDAQAGVAPGPAPPAGPRWRAGPDAGRRPAVFLCDE